MIDILYFELIDANNILRIEPRSYLFQNAEMDWDKNCIKTGITIKAGKISGKFDANFMTIDFEKFKTELTSLYYNLEGTANFSGLERQLHLNIKGDGIGHFKADIIARDSDEYNSSELSYEIAFDQTILKELIEQMTRITGSFPIIGTL